MNTLRWMGANYDVCPFVDVPWLRKVLATGQMLCPQCRHVRREWYPKPLELHLESIPEDFSTGGVSPVALDIFRKDLLQLIQSHLKHSVVGPCYIGGVLIPEFVTCYSGKPVIIRGDTETEYFTCSTCGNVTTRHGDGPAYVVRRTMDNAMAVQDSKGSLYLTEDLALSIDWSQWTNIEFSTIEIYEHPIDGKILPE